MAFRALRAALLGKSGKEVSDHADKDLRLGDETMECGNEYSLQGRFAHNALIPAYEAFRQIRKFRNGKIKEGVKATEYDDIKFGDGRIIPPMHRNYSNREPDVAITDTGYCPRLVQYMTDTSTWYGFISSYKETVLVWIQLRKGKPPVLEMSPVIRASDCDVNSDTSKQRLRDGQNVRESITTKQAMLYLMIMSSIQPIPGQRETVEGQLSAIPQEISDLIRKIEPSEKKAATGTESTPKHERDARAVIKGVATGCGPKIRSLEERGKAKAKDLVDAAGRACSPVSKRGKVGIAGDQGSSKDHKK
ncbi:MAG: hypothetical protein Q9162_005582 [Coniocarpon cinnabarinum]